MLIGYENGIYVRAVPHFKGPSQCAHTAAATSVLQGVINLK